MNKELTSQKIREEVYNKIRKITGAHSVFVDSNASDDQFIELVEYFLPKIDGTPDGQVYAETVFTSRSFNSVEDDEILDEIKANLGSLEVPSNDREVREIKTDIKRAISDYKKRFHATTPKA